MYANLNAHSHYSLLSSTLSIEDLVLFAKKNQMLYVCLTDVNNMYGAVEFYDLAIKHQLKPVLGLEFIYKNSLLVVIAKDYYGYQQLMKISSHLMLEEEFLLNITPHLFIIRKQGDITFDDPHFFVADDLSAPNYIACHSAYFKDADDYEAYVALHVIKNNKLFEEETGLENNRDAYLYNFDDLVNNYLPIGLENLNKLLTQVHLEIKNLPMNIPVFQPSSLIVSSALLEQLCQDGLEQRIGNNHPLYKNYQVRLEYEINVITQMHFEDYFLIVADFINYAKNQDILIGPGRGSAAGSLVAFCLNITDVDPIKYNLVFERFLNPKRKTMPDIDIDIMDRRRDEVFEYLFDKYTNEHTAYIVTFQRIKIKTAIRDVGRILQINLNTINNICKSIDNLDDDNNISLLLQKLHQDYERYPQLFDLAIKLINIPRNIGTHAAGIILSQSLLREVIPLQKGMNDRFLSQYSMEYLERFGLIKIDLLGLINLTFLQDIQMRLTQNYNIKVDLLNINYNDSAVFKDLSNGQTHGIFQLESPAMTNLIKRIKPQSIEDISLVSALLRPGAQEQINQYIANRRYPQQVKYANNAIKEILAPTYGIIVYQEQVIKLVQIIAQFDAAQADLFRRAISKKDNQQLDLLKEHFVSNAVKNNYSVADALHWYEYIHKFGNYGFNHSHSLAYSLVSYWLAYLKHHYPMDFMISLLNNQSHAKNKLKPYLQQVRMYQINVLPIDIRHSHTGFYGNVQNKTIYFGFQIIKGFGNEICKKIMQTNRKTKSYWECFLNLKNNKVSQKNVEILIKIGAFDSYGVSRKFLLANLIKHFSVLELIPDGFFSIDKQEIENEFNLASNSEFIADEINYLGTSWLDLLKEEQSALPIREWISVQINDVKQKITKNKNKFWSVRFTYKNHIYDVNCFNDYQWIINNQYEIYLEKNDRYLRVTNVRVV
ncbi:DNA polymerase III subunit alpha [Ureaplasma sp. ES3154-GEN]|uniref:DNA polymerase III subunit alpha n=1 Tax=Ureaplasma sp. ES3154-GEN TaxID=2984844 RepID=UPI0021E8F288|nr:DNA polymerase III subunit alpha [Ureaplasma sp. ES3154-GEN]MCV3743859.1 DNA polymerase III subunit alpha [Ureaplasma sp. ES3154-GEN]